MPVYWMPAKRTLEEDINEELTRLRESQNRLIESETSEIPSFMKAEEQVEPIQQPSWIVPTPYEAITPAQRTYDEAWLTQPITQPATTQFGYETQPTTQFGYETQPLPIVQPQEVKATTELWEKPKEITEKVMEKVGKGISKVPIVPKALQFISPIFEWIHKSLEEPWAATVLAALSPSLPWRSGESWKQHQIREYEAWKAPTYLKGLAEFSMPLWWIPYFGWAAKGAKALGAGQKVMKGIAIARDITGIPTKAITIPTDAFLNRVLFKSNNFKRLAQFGSRIPGIKQAIELVGGPGVFLNADSTLPLDIAKRSFVKNMGQVRAFSEGVKNLFLPHLQAIDRGARVSKVLGIKADGTITNIVDKSGKNKYLGDVMEGALNNPEGYEFVTQGAKEYIDTYRKVLDWVNEQRLTEGLKVPKGYKYHRMVDGKWIDGKFERSEYGSRFEDPRVHETMAEAIAKPDPITGKLNGIAYALEPTESLAATIEHYITAIGRKRLTDDINKLGKKATEKWALANPNEAKQIDDLVKQLSATKYAKSAVTKLKSYKAETLPGATIRKIREELPDIGKVIDDVLDIPRDEINKIINRVRLDIRRALGIGVTEFRVKLGTATGRTTLNKIGHVISEQSKDKVLGEKLIEKFYKDAYKLKKNEFKLAIDSIRPQIDNLLNTTKGELKSLLIKRREFLSHYQGRGQIFGGEAKFYNIPEFGDRIFPADVQKWVQRKLDDHSARWLRKASTISGTSRMLTAVLDFSPGFIQGAAAIGLNPVAWAQAMGFMFSLAYNPKRLLTYFIHPETVAIRAERAAAGSSLGGFEFFQALKPVKGAVGRIPVIGKPVEKAIEQTFGRAEVLFEGFGEMARNKLWAALRKPNATPDQLFELARTIDRMTGMMSTTALGIGRTQQDIENAFVFFSPKYTRAGLAFVGDILKGGISGAEARKAIGSFLGGGFAMYYGACKALGQEPNLNPNSARFLTVKVGDQHLGIGGISIALMRLAYDISATAVEDPMNLVKPFNESGINRWDNPFVRFMYSRTAPLTSTAIGAVVEQANYYGEPFENIGDWAIFLKDKITPIALQGVTEQGIAGTLGQISGLRQFPKSSTELLEDERNIISKREYGVTYDILLDLQKRQINLMPTTMKLQDDVDAETVQRGDEENISFLNHKREMQMARQIYIDRLNELQIAFDNKFITGYEFKEEMQSAGDGLKATYNYISKLPEYQKILKKMEERDLSDKTRWDLARLEFIARSVSDEMLDEARIFDFDKYENLKKQIIIKYGQDALDYIMAYNAERDKELPPLAQEYKRAQEILRPYWEVTKKIIKLFGERFAESNRGQALIAKLKKRMRLTNPAIAAAYLKFYARE